jgi:hypothetical protein
MHRLIRASLLFAIVLTLGAGPAGTRAPVDAPTRSASPSANRLVVFEAFMRPG